MLALLTDEDLVPASLIYVLRRGMLDQAEVPVTVARRVCPILAGTPSQCDPAAKRE